MEKKRISNTFIIVITFLIITTFIITKTIILINENHENKQIYAMKSKVEYYAKRCYLEEKCSGEITLQTLYDNKYITSEVVNPITKEVIDSNLSIKYEDGKVVINW